MAQSSFDFVVVGGGPAGSALAAGLAKVPCLNILLLEAGGSNEDMEHKAAGNRYSTFMTASGYNWKHQSVPQSHMADRTLNYDAGKGLGGGTAINFGCYTRGPAQDYDAWAKVTGDEQMGWNAARERLKDTETIHAPPEEFEKYCKPANGAHGYSGPIQVSYDTLDDGVKDIIDRGRAFGYATNLDVNSGNVIGMGASLSSAIKGVRTTAAAFFHDKPDNLTVRTKVYVNKVIMEGRKAIGVETADGEKILATREIILSASALRTPHILLLSGIGPAAILSSHSIPVVQDLPGVGQQFRDHGFTFITLAADASIKRPVHDLSEEAQRQWAIDQSGPMVENYCPAAMAFLKTSGIERSDEFKALSKMQQAQVAEPGRPNWELLSNMPPFAPGLNAAETHTFVIAFMNPLSTGSITLRSANPSDPPVVDPKMFSHPFDRRAAIETMREAFRFLDTLKLEYIIAPKDRSDETIWKYVAANTISMWHPSSTVAMGAPDDPLTCLDTDFKVNGVEGLRVVDCSAIPLMISAHTQAPAYNVGAAGAQKILKNYGFETRSDSETKKIPHSLATTGLPTGGGKDKEASEKEKYQSTFKDENEGTSSPSDRREYDAAEEELPKTADQPGNPLVSRRASTWSPFSGVASRLQRRFSTKPRGVSKVTPLARSRTNEEVPKKFVEEEDEEPKAAHDPLPELEINEEAPKEANQQLPKAGKQEVQEAETSKLSRRFSVFRAVSVKHKAPKVPKVPKTEVHKVPEIPKTLEAESLDLVEEAETIKVEIAERPKETKGIVPKRSRTEPLKATKATAPKAAKAKTSKPLQARTPKMDNGGLPKVSKQNVSQVSRNAIYKAMEAGVPKTPQAEAPRTMEAKRTKEESLKPKAVHVETPKVAKAQIVLGSDDNDWCFLA